MSDQQIRDTVASMRMTDQERAILLRQALAGNQGARFTIYAILHSKRGGER